MNLETMDTFLAYHLRMWMQAKEEYRRFIHYIGNVGYRRGTEHPANRLRARYIYLLAAVRRRDAIVRKQKTFLCPHV
jgi:hypothetical protein